MKKLSLVLVGFLAVPVIALGITVGRDIPAEIDALEVDVGDHETRVTTLESQVTSLQAGVLTTDPSARAAFFLGDRHPVDIVRGNLCTVTPYMGQRAGIVNTTDGAIQLCGKTDGTLPDQLTFTRGSQVSGNFYQTYDTGQGTIAMWIRPRSANPGYARYVMYNAPMIAFNSASSAILFRPANASDYAAAGGTAVAGTAFFGACIWDYDNDVTGTSNSMSWWNATSGTLATFASAQDNTATKYIGTTTSSYSLNGNIDYPHFYRWPATTNTISSIYNSGNGADPSTLIGAEHLTFALRGDGTAEAWSGSVTDEACRWDWSLNKLTSWHGQATTSWTGWVEADTDAADIKLGAASLRITGGASNSWSATSGNDLFVEVVSRDDGSSVITQTVAGIGINTAGGGTWEDNNWCVEADATETKYVIFQPDATLMPSNMYYYAEVADGANMDLPMDLVINNVTNMLVTGYTADKLVSIDISDPSNPSVLTSVTDGLMDAPHGVCVLSNYAYVACSGTNAIVAVDVTDPSSMVVTGTVAHAALDGVSKVVAEGNYLYSTAVDYDGLAITYIADPGSMVVTGSVTAATLNMPTGIAKSGTNCFVTCATDDRLTVVNVSDPTSPSVTTNIVDATQLDAPYGIVISGNYAYIACQSDRLTVVDISTPTAPLIVGTIQSATALDDATDVVYESPYCYVSAQNDDMVTAVDVSTPASPTVVYSVTDAEIDAPMGITKGGEYVYTVAANTDRLAVVRVPGHDGHVQQCQVVLSAVDKGGFESWSDAEDADGWTEDVNGTSTVSNETSHVHSGSNSVELTTDGSASSCSVAQTLTLVSGTFYQFSMWHSADSGTPVLSWSISNSNVSTDQDVTTSMTDTRTTKIFRASGTSCVLTIKSDTTASSVVNVDDASVVALAGVTLTATPATLRNSFQRFTDPGSLDGSYYALRLDGSDTATVPTSGVLSTSAGTIAMWVYPIQPATAHPAEAAVYHYNSGHEISLKRSANSGVWRATAGSATSVMTTTHAQSTWAFLTMTWNGTNIAAYHNGSAEDTDAYGSLSSLTTVFNVGGTGAVGSSGDLYILGPWIWQRALTPGEIGGIYEATLPYAPNVLGGEEPLRKVARYTAGGSIARNDAVVLNATSTVVSSSSAAQKLFKGSALTEAANTEEIYVGVYGPFIVKGTGTINIGDLVETSSTAGTLQAVSSPGNGAYGPASLSSVSGGVVEVNVDVR